MFPATNLKVSSFCILTQQMQSIHTIVNSVNKSTLRKYPMTTPPNRDTQIIPWYIVNIRWALFIFLRNDTHCITSICIDQTETSPCCHYLSSQGDYRTEAICLFGILFWHGPHAHLISYVFLYAICLVSLFSHTKAWATTRLNLNSWMDLIFHSIVFSCLIHAQNLQHNKRRCARWWCIVPVWNIMSWHEWWWSKPSWSIRSISFNISKSPACMQLKQ